MWKKVSTLVSGFILIGSIACANPFQETEYFSDNLVSVYNEHNRVEALLDVNSCTKRTYDMCAEYNGKVHFVDGVKDVSIRFFHGFDDDWAIIKFKDEDEFKLLRVDDILLVRLYYFMHDFAKKVEI